MRLTAMALLALLASCTRQAPAPRDMDARETMGMLRNRFAVLVDARPVQAQAGGIAEGAQAVTSTEVGSPAWKTVLDSVPADGTVVVYAESASAARELAGKLTAAGRRAAVLVALKEGACRPEMDGTLEAWKCAGFPVRR
jgi:rhodanese-related sulfurtransferase